MNLRPLLSASFFGVVLALVIASPSYADGTFDIPPGAHFNQEKLAKVGEFFRNEVATARLPAPSS